ncbi:vinculin-like isoform X3 [Ptychodera flava]|uniref:vinculin-like isoform X3 n=1 Tax=Ptychodera flava TaxID=63121 RepID=UPI00396A632C
MPVFHTKTIEAILDPVAQQVSQLVILHEEAEDGNAMPDLYRPVQAVCAAVNNLVKVGRETAASSQDKILKQELPLALNRVEEATGFLVEASGMLRDDPFSVSARKKLIDGARGILSGTSALLLAFDEAEVRKIIRVCKSVLEYLAVAEVVESMEDLVTFVKNLTPGMTGMSKNIEAREKELIHQVHKEKLSSSLKTVKNLTPVLISGIKIFVTTKQTGGRGVPEAAENRNYVVSKMSQEIHEIIRILQLTTYDEEGWDVDDITVMKKAQAGILGQIDLAREWLGNPSADPSGLGERSIRQIVDEARKVAAICDGPERDELMRVADEISAMTDQLAHMRARGEGNSPEAQQLARAIQDRVEYLGGRVDSAVAHHAQSGIRKPAPTVSGKVEQAQQWLAAPSVNDRGLGQQALRQVIGEGRKVAEGCVGRERERLHKLCDDCEVLTNQLDELCRQGKGNTPQAQAVARHLSSKLNELRDAIQESLVQQVANDFIDPYTPLKLFSKAAYAPLGTPNREAEFQNKAAAFDANTQRLANTAQRMAEAGGCSDKKVVENLLQKAQQMRDLTPQVIYAGRILMENPENDQRLRHDAAKEHFEMLKKEWTGNMDQLIGLVDEATDTVSFIKATEDAIRRDNELVDMAIKQRQPAQVAGGASDMARRGKRVVEVARQEMENSEDPNFVDKVGKATNNLEKIISPLVINAKAVAVKPGDKEAEDNWYTSSDSMIGAVVDIRQAIVKAQQERYPVPPKSPEPIPEEQFPPPPDMSQLHISEGGMTKPLDRPMPQAAGYGHPGQEQVSPSEVRGELQQHQQHHQPDSAASIPSPPPVPPSSEVVDSGSVYSAPLPPPPLPPLPHVPPAPAASPTRRGLPVPPPPPPPPPPSASESVHSRPPRGASPTFSSSSGPVTVKTQLTTEISSATFPRTQQRRASPGSTSPTPQGPLAAHSPPLSDTAADMSHARPPQYRSSPTFSGPPVPAGYETVPASATRTVTTITPSPPPSSPQSSGHKTSLARSSRSPPPPPPPPPHQRKKPPSEGDGFKEFYKELDSVLDSVMSGDYQRSRGSHTAGGPPRPVGEKAPPRPPLPESDHPPPRPPPPEESDDEMEVHFPKPQADQPIMTAAYSLHVEAQKWSSKGNEIVAAAKKMALLMAKMSQLVRGEGGSKKELIDCAKAIALASEEVTRLAREVANQCTDKRMRTNLLQVCERIPTISTQLKILSTVKATMLGAQGSDEDQEATEMLVGNAQNLMQSVKETVRAAEAASIKIRTDSGHTLRWVRKRPWYL